MPPNGGPKRDIHKSKHYLNITQAPFRAPYLDRFLESEAAKKIPGIIWRQNLFLSILFL